VTLVPYSLTGMAGGACDIRVKAVTEYRAYSVGGDGHFTGCAPLTCANDAEAIAQARMLVDDFHAAELWTGARLVERLSLVGTKFPELVGQGNQTAVAHPIQAEALERDSAPLSPTDRDASKRKPPPI
jgi:hypothetical protein